MNLEPVKNLPSKLIHVKVMTLAENIEFLKTLAYKQKRGENTYIFDFKKEKIEGKDVLSFHVGEVLRDGILLSSARVLTTFQDFCWIYVDGSTEKSLLEINTPVNSEARPGSLNWLLPSRFADDLIECLAYLNDELFGGALQDAVLIGPYYKTGTWL